MAKLKDHMEDERQKRNEELDDLYQEEQELKEVLPASIINKNITK